MSVPVVRIHGRKKVGELTLRIERGEIQGLLLVKDKAGKILSRVAISFPLRDVLAEVKQAFNDRPGSGLLNLGKAVKKAAVRKVVKAADKHVSSPRPAPRPAPAPRARVVQTTSAVQQFARPKPKPQPAKAKPPGVFQRLAAQKTPKASVQPFPQKFSAVTPPANRIVMPAPVAPAEVLEPSPALDLLANEYDLDEVQAQEESDEGYVPAEQYEDSPEDEADTYIESTDADY